jgi:hypothetical protein
VASRDLLVDEVPDVTEQSAHGSAEEVDDPERALRRSVGAGMAGWREPRRLRRQWLLESEGRGKRYRQVPLDGMTGLRTTARE